MIEILKKFDNQEAMGLLARTALSLETGETNPASKPLLKEEIQLREILLKEIRDQLGLKSAEYNHEAIHLICNFIDNETDKLISPPDINAAMQRLSLRGDLPTEFYDVSIEPSIADIHKSKYQLEESLIRKTVRTPDREQHYGEPINDKDPYLLSLFGRYFIDKYPYRNFLMLVVGQRSGTYMNVSMAWRIYINPLNVSNEISLLETLKIFANEYGFNVKRKDKVGKFILSSEEEDNINLKADIPAGKAYTMTTFYQNNPDNGKVIKTFTIAIDTDKYLKKLKDMHAYDTTLLNI